MLALPVAWQECRVAWSEHLAVAGGTPALESAIACAPGDGSLWRALGAAQLQAHDPAAASALQEAVYLNPYDAESRAALGLIAESQGHPVEAERDLIAATQMSP